MLEIEKFIRENNITEKLSKKAVDKIYTRAALNCISKFHNFTREKKIIFIKLNYGIFEERSFRRSFQCRLS